LESILLVYKSKTGFTKKYLDWITEEISCQTIPIEHIHTVEMNRYDIIVYGAGIHAGRIQGLKEFKKKVLDLNNKKIVVFATGGAPYSEEIISKIIAENFTADELNDINFFYFQSGISYERMRFADKAIMKLYSKMLEFKKNKSDIEDGTSKAVSSSYDHSSRDHIKPLITYLRDNQAENRLL